MKFKTVLLLKTNKICEIKSKFRNIYKGLLFLIDLFSNNTSIVGI